MNQNVKKILKFFAIKSAIVFTIWMIVYHGFIEPDGRANRWLTTKVVEGTKFGLTTLGYDTSHEWKTEENDKTRSYIYIDGEPVVLVADPCNGLELIALFMGFIICFPGSWKYKWITILLGSSIVFVLNVIREIVLALNYKYFAESFEFNHKYTYVLIVYISIFLIWRVWLNKYSLIGKYGHE